uniref:Uncharacterized protein n=1 Tax=Tanacetum cinerariifolium TaxID=118510 RepID=A0A6L2KT88_TANCI|nr:hypothetical protein [Tanacetum cinerariifolium]
MRKANVEKYITKSREDYGSGITRPWCDEKARFELKGQFLKELRDNAFSGTNGEDAVEHIEIFLKTVDSLDIPNVDLIGFFRKYYLPSCTGRKMEANEVNTKVEWDPTNIKIRRGDDEEVIINDELSNLGDENLIEETEIAKIFRIETDIFKFETSLSNMSWLDYGPWMEPSDDIEHVYIPFRFKDGHAKWPTCNWKSDKYRNGGYLRGVIQIRDEIYFESYEWYKNLGDGELIDEAVNYKALLIFNDHVGTNNDYETQENDGRFDEHELTEDDDNDIDDLEDYLIRKDGPYYVNEVEEKSEKRCKLLGIPYMRLPTCK